jgi:hypothetical protein
MHKKKLVVLSVLIAFVLLGAATSLRQKKGRNLKVLPKDISDHMLDSIMQTYNKALGVTCNFCHTPDNGVSVADSINYALDYSMKENARRMMMLNININKTYFYYDTASRPEYLKVITCKTCHQGHPFPPED